MKEKTRYDTVLVQSSADAVSLLSASTSTMVCYLPLPEVIQGRLANRAI